MPGKTTKQAQAGAVVLESHGGARRKLETQLDRMGFQVFSCSTVEQAVERVDQDWPVLVMASVGVADADLCEYVLNVSESRPALALIVPKGKERKAAGLPADVRLFRPYNDDTFQAAVELLKKLGVSRRREAQLERMVEERGGVLKGGGDDRRRLYHIDFFKQLLLVEIRRAKRYGYPLSVLLLSLDPYRLPPGRLTTRRQVRSAVARAVSDSIRDIDIPVYVGQEKLLVLLPHTDVEGARKVGRRLVRQIEKGSLTHRGEEIQVTASIGVAGTSRGRRVSFAKLMSDARKALEEARRGGGNRVTIVS